ncbi:MAG: cupin-like domain-containing protein [Solirubrobacteraceae bacterium]|nr:cupin-like domain-containing protein [Solirubrobacteraceae bacterium]
MTTIEQRDQAAQWHAWIAENLLRGVSPYDIAGTMEASGVDRSSAEQAIASAADHPYLQGARVAAEAAAAASAAKLASNAAAPGSSARAKKYAWWLEVQRRAARLSSHHGELPRVTNPSAEEFLEDFYSRNRACVIEGAMESWPALERWQSPDYLKSVCGDAIVEAQSRGNAGGDAATLSDANLAKSLPFGEFIDIVETAGESQDWYMIANNGAKNLQPLLPLLDDVAYAPFLQPDPARTFLWYGPKGIVTPLHHDLTNNLMAQVRGRKYIQLIAPHESAHMYNHVHRYSQVDSFDIDYDAFPAMRDVTIVDVELGPGQMLFIPSGWWHAVRGLDISITLTMMRFPWDNEFHEFYDSYGEL